MIVLLAIFLLLVPAYAQAVTVCQIQTTAVGWTWVCPGSGNNSVPKTVAIAKLDIQDLLHSCDNTASTVETKYGGGSWNAWASAQSTWALSQGINTAGQYSFEYQTVHPTGGIPYVPTEDAPTYACETPYWSKNAAALPATGSMTCGSSFYQGGFTVDPFDPETTTAIDALMSSAGSVLEQGDDALQRYYVPADGDSLFLYDSRSTHADGGLQVLANTPLITAASTGSCGTHTYTDGTNFSKLGMADYLATEYGCVGTSVSITSTSEPTPGYIVHAVNSGTNGFSANQLIRVTGITPSGYNTIAMVLPTGLSATTFQYIVPTGNLAAGGAGTAAAAESPYATDTTEIALPYCGSSAASTALTALNTAWSTSYTTWGTSQAGTNSGISTLSGKTYTSYGTGTGFLDENGSHVISATQQTDCAGLGGTGPTVIDNWATHTQIKTDVDNFLAYMSALYLEIQRAAATAVCGSSCPPEAQLYYDAPDQVYQAGAPYVDVWGANPSDQSFYTNVAGVESRFQDIINSDGGTPIIAYDYSTATPNSRETNVAPPGACISNQLQFCFSTQTLRQQYDVALWNTIRLYQDPWSRYNIIGFEHWALYDDCREPSNYGYKSSLDNPYDGSAASTATSSGAWTASHTYTMPTIIFDGTNYEGMCISGQPGVTCTSKSGSAPVWSTSFGGHTTDNTCIWCNEGPYTPAAEAANYGDFMQPLSVLLTSNLADPTSSTGVGGSNGVNGPGTW